MFLTKLSASFFNWEKSLIRLSRRIEIVSSGGTHLKVAGLARVFCTMPICCSSASNRRHLVLGHLQTLRLLYPYYLSLT